MLFLAFSCTHERNVQAALSALCENIFLDTLLYPAISMQPEHFLVLGGRKVYKVKLKICTAGSYTSSSKGL
jgi:hypothetical protein